MHHLLIEDYQGGLTISLEDDEGELWGQYQVGYDHQPFRKSYDPYQPDDPEELEWWPVIEAGSEEEQIWHAYTVENPKFYEEIQIEILEAIHG